LTSGLLFVNVVAMMMGLRNFFDPSWVSHLWFGFGRFPLKIPNFSIFLPSGQNKSHQVGSKSTRVKDGLASYSYLLWVKNMLWSDWVRADLYSVTRQQ